MISAGADLHISLPQVSQVKGGPSAGAAVAAAIVAMAYGCKGVRLRPGGCAVTGEVDLAGRLLPVDEVLGKVKQAYMSNSIGTVVAPRAQAEALLAQARDRGGCFAAAFTDEEEAEDGGREAFREFVLQAVKPAETMVDVIGHIFQGVRGGWCAAGRRINGC